MDALHQGCKHLPPIQCISANPPISFFRIPVHEVNFFQFTQTAVVRNKKG
jgi:hypothetical protein